MAYHYLKNIYAAFKERVQLAVYDIVDSGAPTNGTSGTGAGFAGIGSTYTDTVTGNCYINTGTKASPTWLVYNPGNTYISGTGQVSLAKATYDFSVDGGAISTITFATNATIPSGAIILGGIIDVLTPGTTSASGTMALGTSAGSSTTSLKAALAAASYTGLVAVVPVFTAATMVKLTAAGQITGTIATGALTAGKWNVIVAYVLGS